MDFPFPISFPDDCPMDAIRNSPLIKRWASSIDPSIAINRVSVLSADMFGKRLGMVELDVFYTANEIEHNERIILTGKSSMMVILMQCIEIDELYTILVHQPRIGSGGLLFEFPAGMADDSLDFRAVAVREIHEEVGMTCTPDELIHVSSLYRPNDPYTFINEAHYDMGCHVFLVRRRMSLAEIMAYDGRSGGISADEQIQLKVVRFDEVSRYAMEPATLGSRYMVGQLLASGAL